MARDDQIGIQKELRELTTELKDLNTKQKGVAEAVLDAAKEGKSNTELAQAGAGALNEKLKDMIGKMPLIGGSINFGRAIIKARREGRIRRDQEKLFQQQLGLNDEQFKQFKEAKKQADLRKEEKEAFEKFATNLGISDDERTKLLQNQSRAYELQMSNGTRLYDTIDKQFTSQDKINRQRNSILEKSLDRLNTKDDVVAESLVQLKESSNETAKNLKDSKNAMEKAVLSKEKEQGPSASQQVELRNEEMRSAERRHAELINTIKASMGGGEGDVKEESGFLGGLLKVMASIGPMIGATIGAIGAGLAAVGAVAGPAIIGSLVLGGAILVIGAAIAGAATLMGASMPIVADGLNKIQPSLKKLEELNGVKLAQAADGIGALFFPLMGLGVGGLLAKLADAKHLGDLGTALQEFDKIDGDNLAKVGEGLGPFGGGLAKFALGDTFAKIVEFFSGGDMNTSLANLAQGLVVFENINGENLAAVGKGVSGLGDGFASLAGGGILQGLLGIFKDNTPLEDFGNDLAKFNYATKDVDTRHIMRIAQSVDVIGDAVSKFKNIEQGVFQAFGFKQLGADLEQFADYLDDGELDTIERAAEVMNKFKNILTKNGGSAQTGGGDFTTTRPQESGILYARQQRTAEMNATFAENQDMRSAAPAIVNAPNTSVVNNSSSQNVSMPINVVDSDREMRYINMSDF